MLLARRTTSFSNPKDGPTLIIVDSHMAYGSPHKQDTKEAHGEALGEEEVRLSKKVYGWPENANFLVPDGVRENFQQGIGKRGRELRATMAEAFRRLWQEISATRRSFESHVAARTS